jgi:hypothetical protein
MRAEVFQQVALQAPAVLALQVAAILYHTIPSYPTRPVLCPTPYIPYRLLYTSPL